MDTDTWKLTSGDAERRDWKRVGGRVPFGVSIYPLGSAALANTLPSESATGSVLLGDFGDSVSALHRLACLTSTALDLWVPVDAGIPPERAPLTLFAPSAGQFDGTYQGYSSPNGHEMPTHHWQKDDGTEVQDVTHWTPRLSEPGIRPLAGPNFND